MPAVASVGVAPAPALKRDVGLSLVHDDVGHGGHADRVIGVRAQAVRKSSKSFGPPRLPSNRDPAMSPTTVPLPTWAASVHLRLLPFSVPDLAFPKRLQDESLYTHASAHRDGHMVLTFPKR